MSTALRGVLLVRMGWQNSSTANMGCGGCLFKVYKKGNAWSISMRLLDELMGQNPWHGGWSARRDAWDVQPPRPGQFAMLSFHDAWKYCAQLFKVKRRHPTPITALELRPSRTGVLWSDTVRLQLCQNLYSALLYIISQWTAELFDVSGTCS